MAIRHGSGGWMIKATGISDAKDIFELFGVTFDGDAAFVVGPQVHYGKWHETGTKKMAARPYMEPAAELVDGDIEHYARQISDSQGIPLDSFDNIVNAVALAVEAEAKRIANEKEIRDTGTLINSITARRR